MKIIILFLDSSSSFVFLFSLIWASYLREKGFHNEVLMSGNFKIEILNSLFFFLSIASIILAALNMLFLANEIGWLVFSPILALVLALLFLTIRHADYPNCISLKSSNIFILQLILIGLFLVYLLTLFLLGIKENSYDIMGVFVSIVLFGIPMMLGIWQFVLILKYEAWVRCHFYNLNMAGNKNKKEYLTAPRQVFQKETNWKTAKLPENLNFINIFDIQISQKRQLNLQNESYEEFLSSSQNDLPLTKIFYPGRFILFLNKPDERFSKDLYGRHIGMQFPFNSQLVGIPLEIVGFDINSSFFQVINLDYKISGTLPYGLLEETSNYLLSSPVNVSKIEKLLGWSIKPQFFS